MEFDESKVYTALNADKLKIGSEVIVADNLGRLKSFVKDDCETKKLVDIREEQNKRLIKKSYFKRGNQNDSKRICEE